MSKTPERLTAADFEMKWDAERTFSFTESEDATIMAFGHPDKDALAAEIAEYDRLCAGPAYSADAWETSPDDIRQTYAVLVEGGPGDEWVIKWEQDAKAPGAFPVSVVRR
jgi:hypothetical protein